MSSSLRFCLNEDNELDETTEILVDFYSDDGYFHFIRIDKDNELWVMLCDLRDKQLKAELEKHHIDV